MSESELDYYRRLSDELGARCVRLQEELDGSRRDLHRSRALSRIVRMSDQICRDGGGEERAVQRFLLMALGELKLVKAAFFRLHEEQNVYVSAGSSGMRRRDPCRFVPPPGLQDFHFASEAYPPGPVERSLREIVDAECLLWSRDRNRGVALLLGGCAQPRDKRCHVTPGDRWVMEGLLDILLDLLDRRRAERAAEESRRFLAEVLDALPDPLAVKNDSHRWVFVNRSFCRLMGLPADSLLGKSNFDFFPPEEAAESWRDDDEVLATGRESLAEKRMSFPTGRTLTVSTKKALARAAEGAEPVLVASIRDVSEMREAEAKLEESLREKEILLREIHHRVKNNLQVVSSLLTLQDEQLHDQRDGDILRESRNRVQAMAFIHDRLYRSDTLSRVDFNDYVEHLSNHLLRTYGVRDGRIRMVNSVSCARLSIDQAMPCGLAVCELLGNALRHGFPRERTGSVSVSLTPDPDGMARLEVRDDGIGLPRGFSPQASSGLGLRLVSSLAAQLGGELVSGADDGGGAAFSIRFPLD